MASIEHASAAGAVKRRPRSRRRPSIAVWFRNQNLIWQVLVGLAVLAGWQYLPTIDWLSNHIKFLDPFVISSPTKVWEALVSMLTGNGAAASGITAWQPLKWTVTAALEGSAIGLVLGAFTGLLFSQSERLATIMQPYIVLANTVPRVALIPIFVLIAGPTITAEVLSIVVVVFFLTYFNALAGGRSVSQAMLDNARLLGAGPGGIMVSIRLPLVIKWTIAVVPNAISFGLLVAVTTELLAGLPGMGNILLTATSNIDAALTFAIIVVLSIVGLLLYLVTQLLSKRIIRW